MKKLFTPFLGMAALAALCLAQAANAAPVGSLTCATSTQEIKFNVSYFTFGVAQTLNIGSQSGGAGAGKVTFSPLEVHAALSTFASLIDTAANGVALQTCTLTTKLSDGTTDSFEFKLVAIKGLTVVAEKTGTTDIPAQYTDVQFEYGSVEVKTSGGTDDGGTTPPGGWNQITNSGGTGTSPIN